MIGVDTNVLVRFLVEDDEQQAAKVIALFEKVIAEDSTLFISDIVLCETVRVLSSRYHFYGAILRRSFKGFSRLTICRSRRPDNTWTHCNHTHEVKAISRTTSFVNSVLQPVAPPW